jgi:hypothetical protein
MVEDIFAYPILGAITIGFLVATWVLTIVYALAKPK